MTDRRGLFSLYLLRGLAMHNRLHGMMSFIAVWWSVWTMVSPTFWRSAIARQSIYDLTSGHPMVVSYALLLSGIMGYVSFMYRSWWLRAVGAMIGFVCWSLLTLVFLTATPVLFSGVAVYSSLALAKLVSYVHFVSGLDDVYPLRRHDDR